MLTYGPLYGVTIETRGVTLGGFIVVLVVGCAKTPEKVCAHEVELSPLVANGQCVDQLMPFQKADPARFDVYARCVLEAKNLATLGECNDKFHPGDAAERNKPASVDEAMGTIRDVARLLRLRYAKTKSLCPSAQPVPAKLEQITQSTLEPGGAYIASPNDWSGDPGWGCMLDCEPGSCFFTPWMKRPIHWQYEFTRQAGIGVTVVARGPAGDGKIKEISKRLVVDGDSLTDDKTDRSERVLR